MLPAPLCWLTSKEACSRGTLRVIIRRHQSSLFMRHSQSIDDSSNARSPVQILVLAMFVSWSFVVSHFNKRKDPKKQSKQVQGRDRQTKPHGLFKHRRTHCCLATAAPSPKPVSWLDSVFMLLSAHDGQIPAARCLDKTWLKRGGSPVPRKARRWV